MCKLDILDHLGMPSAGDSLSGPGSLANNPPSTVPPPDYPGPITENNISHSMSTVDQEVQTDFVHPTVLQTAVASSTHIPESQEITPDPSRGPTRDPSRDITRDPSRE